MNETYEQEIDLKWLIYRVLRAWRPIVVWAIIIGIVVGIGSFVKNFIKISNEDYIASAKMSYERAHASWVAKEENLLAKLENLEKEKSRQLEYNDKSIIMQIDPLRDFHASFELYIDYDYQIMPNMSYQNIDLSDRILRAYATYMTNGELEQYIIDNLSYDIELRYLKEIFRTSVDYNNNFITVSVRHSSAEGCQEILNIAKEGILSRYETVCANIAEHKIADTNAAAYETISLSLEDTQKANLQYINDMDMSIQEVNEELLEWAREPEPQEEYTFNEVVKSAVKLLIIAGVVAGVVLAIIVAFGALMSGKLLNPEDLKNRFGLRVIGQLPTKRVKKPFAFMSRLFCKFGGITVTPEDYDRLVKMIGTSIKSDLSSREEVVYWKKIAFTGMVSDAELKIMVDVMGLDKYFSVVCAANVLSDAESIEKVVDADCVILVEKQEQSLLADITKELEALKAWNKTVLGAVVLNVDAVM